MIKSLGVTSLTKNGSFIGCYIVLFNDGKKLSSKSRYNIASRVSKDSSKLWEYIDNGCLFCMKVPEKYWGYSSSSIELPNELDNTVLKCDEIVQSDFLKMLKNSNPQISVSPQRFGCALLDTDNWIGFSDGVFVCQYDIKKDNLEFQVNNADNIVLGYTKPIFILVASSTRHIKDCYFTTLDISRQGAFLTTRKKYDKTIATCVYKYNYNLRLWERMNRGNEIEVFGVKTI